MTSFVASSPSRRCYYSSSSLRRRTSSSSCSLKKKNTNRGFPTGRRRRRRSVVFVAECGEKTTKPFEEEEEHDDGSAFSVCVLGCGPAGLTTALAMQKMLRGKDTPSSSSPALRITAFDKNPNAMDGNLGGGLTSTAARRYWRS